MQGLFNLSGEILADSRDFLQAALCGDFRQILIEITQRARRVLIGNDPETVFALQRQHARHLLEHVRDIGIEHWSWHCAQLDRWAKDLYVMLVTRECRRARAIVILPFLANSANV